MIMAVCSGLQAAVDANPGRYCQLRRRPRQHPAGQALAQGGKGSFHLGAAEEDIVSFGYAASRSRADR
jgi:hypothetical protein